MCTTSYMRVAAVCLGMAFAHMAAGGGSSQSEALEIAKAGGLKKVRDVSREDVEKALRKEGKHSSGALGGLAAGQAAGVFSPTPGLSAGTSAGVLAVGAFLTSLPVAQPERDARFFAWMPKELAPDPVSAVALFTTTIVSAVSEALPEYEVELVDLPTQRRSDPRKGIKVTGPDCSPCILASLIFQGAAPREDTAPTRLGSYDAYAWAGFNSYGVGTFSGFPSDMKVEQNTIRIDVLKRVSKHLPRWVYIYLPPHERLVPYPLMIHQGRELLFVEPGLIAQASVDEEMEPGSGASSTP